MPDEQVPSTGTVVDGQLPNELEQLADVIADILAREYLRELEIQS